jgi:two-component system, NtrC family, sensor histidine kinase HydH
LEQRLFRFTDKFITALRLSIIAGGILGVSVLHYFTPLSEPVLHDIYQRLYYLPIILAAFWFGMKGGIGTAIIVSLPHVVYQWGGYAGHSGHNAMEVDKFLEILIYNLVGAVTGFLSEQEKCRRDQLERTAAGLERSYQELQCQSDCTIRIEEQLRKAERLSVLGELSAVLAHEIRNPLGSIHGTAEILKDDYRPGDKKYEFLDILLKESDRLNRVVEDFLRLSRPQPLVLAPCNIGEELRSIVMLVAAEAKDRDIRLEVHADENLEITGDKDKLHQAFLNIIINGLQAVPDKGSIVIEARMLNNAAPDVAELEIIFRDSGPEIPEDLQKKIFEPFFSTKKDGTGLGLSIAKKIIESHAGNLTVVSEAQKGTAFKVRLPVVFPSNSVAQLEKAESQEDKS